MAHRKKCTGCGGVFPNTAKHYHRDPRKNQPERRRMQCKRCESVRRHKNHLKAEYGITVEEYHAILYGQGKQCPICLSPIADHPFGVGKRTANTVGHVDHCHTTGKIRGILCSVCNRALGLFGDDYDKLERAIWYVR